MKVAKKRGPVGVNAGWDLRQELDEVPRKASSDVVVGRAIVFKVKEPECKLRISAVG